MNARVLAKVDASATVSLVRRGASTSSMLDGLAKRLWNACMKYGWTIRCEHISGDEMVRNGVDGMSRVHEFKVAHRVRERLVKAWGKPTLDWWSSPKLKVCDRFCCMGGKGGSVGDARSVPLEGEFLWVVPPLTRIDYALQRMRQEKARGVVVVPLWRTCAYYAWRDWAKAEYVCPWSRSHPVIGYSDGTAHELNRYQFVAWHMDFTDRRGKSPYPAPPPRVGRQKVCVDVGVGRRTQKAHTPGKWEADGITVLSCFDGAAGGLLALRRAGFTVKQYWRVEVDRWCNLVAATLVEAKVCAVMDIKQVWGDEVGPDWPVWAEVDLFMMGWPCQDLSRANIYGKGLLGPRSSLFFHGARLWEKVRAANPDAVLFGECVARWNRRGHYKFASDTVLKVQPVVVCSGGHSYCRRERAYWLSWKVGRLTKCRADAADILDEGRHPVDKHGHRVTKLATLMVHRSSWNTKNPVWDATLGEYDDLRIHEAERAMEMPEGHTAMGVGGMVIPPEERFKMVGNAFNVHTVASLLSEGRQQITARAWMNHRGQTRQQP